MNRGGDLSTCYFSVLEYSQLVPWLRETSDFLIANQPENTNFFF